MEQHVDELAAAKHDLWVKQQRDEGLESWLMPGGTDEELMVPFADLSETAKSLSRDPVRSVLAAAESIGYALVPVRELVAAVEEALAVVRDLDPEGAQC